MSQYALELGMLMLVSYPINIPYCDQILQIATNTCICSTHQHDKAPSYISHLLIGCFCRSHVHALVFVKAASDLLMPMLLCCGQGKTGWVFIENR